MAKLQLNQPTRLPLVFPSILASDFARLADEVQSVVDAGADGIHIDVMDGHFVPNLTVGPALVECLRGHIPEAYFDVHLMVAEPWLFVEPFAKAGADNISFQIEPVLGRQVEHAEALVQRIHDAGCNACVVLNPTTPAGAIEQVIDQVDMVLVMSVHPGFGGQAFMPEVLPKTREIRQRLRDDQRLEIDGGITDETVAAAREAGVDVIVAGSSIFRSEDRQTAINSLRGSGSAD